MGGAPDAEAAGKFIHTERGRLEYLDLATPELTDVAA